jgi:hypothetical protein
MCKQEEKAFVSVPNDDKGPSKYTVSRQYAEAN